MKEILSVSTKPNRNGLPQWLSSKESTCNAGAAGDSGSIPGLGRSPGGGHGNRLQHSCLENPHGQRSLAGYSPWGHKESEVKRLSTHTPQSHQELRVFPQRLGPGHLPGHDRWLLF